jgi:hypothetical protein
MTNLGSKVKFVNGCYAWTCGQDLMDTIFYFPDLVLHKPQDKLIVHGETSTNPKIN